MMNHMVNSSGAHKIAFAGVVAALYATLTVSLSAIGFGPVQFRVAEALCILPYYFPFSAWGLFVGCIIANLFSPFPLDIAVGPAATLIAALCTMQIGKPGRYGAPAQAPRRAMGSVTRKVLACFPPVVLNALFIGALIAYYMVGAGETDSFITAFLVNGLQVGFGQAVVLYALGLPLLVYMPKSPIYKKLNEHFLY